MKKLASTKQQFSDLRHEWKSKKQSLMVMDSPCCKSDDEDSMRRSRVPSLSSYYSSEVDDGTGDGEVWRGLKGDSYLEQRFIELEHEWNSIKNSIPATRFGARIPPTTPIFSPIKFQGRRLFEDSDSYSDSESRKLHTVSVSSTSSSASDLHDGEFVVGACSELGDIHMNDGCGVMGTKRWREVMVASLIIFALGFVSVACAQFQLRRNVFLVPT